MAKTISFAQAMLMYGEEIAEHLINDCGVALYQDHLLILVRTDQTGRPEIWDHQFDISTMPEECLGDICGGKVLVHLSRENLLPTGAPKKVYRLASQMLELMDAYIAFSAGLTRIFNYPASYLGSLADATKAYFFFKLDGAEETDALADTLRDACAEVEQLATEHLQPLVNSRPAYARFASVNHQGENHFCLSIVFALNMRGEIASMLQ